MPLTYVNRTGQTEEEPENQILFKDRFLFAIQIYHQHHLQENQVCPRFLWRTDSKHDARKKRTTNLQSVDFRLAKEDLPNSQSQHKATLHTIFHFHSNQSSTARWEDVNQVFLQLRLY